MSDSKAASMEAIQNIAAKSGIKPEIRAYYLLMLANFYNSGADYEAMESRFVSLPDISTMRIESRGWDKVLEPNLMGAAEPAPSRKTHTGPATEGKETHRTQGIQLARQATDEAVALLNKCDDPYAKFVLYFVAARWYENAGNFAGMQKCDAVINQLFRLCESPSVVDEQTIHAAASILNAKSFKVIPVWFPDPRWGPVTKSKTIVYTESEFKQSEKLKLKAAALTDRLGTGNDLRRMAHRDLAIWYILLGKPELADKQKQILFDLVGSKDDRLLYPQFAACGQLVWWKTEPVVSNYSCGMG